MHYKKFLKGSSDPILIVNMGLTRIIQANPKACELLEYSYDELLQTPPETIHPHEIPALRGFAEKVKQQGLAITDDLSCRTRTGKILPSVVTASLFQTPDEPSMLVLIHVVNPRESRGGVLKVSENSLLKAERMGAFGCWEGDLVTGERRWSEGMYRILGLNESEAEPSRETLMRLMHPDDHKKMLDAIEHAKAQGEGVSDITYRIKRPDGEERFIHSVAQVFEDDPGVSTKVVGMARDVTERIKYEQVLLERKVRLMLVNEIAITITSDMSIEDVIDNALKSIFELFPNYRVNYVVRTQDDTYIITSSLHPVGMKDIEGTQFNISIAPEYVESLMLGPVFIEDVWSDERVKLILDELTEMQIGAMISTPVRHADGLRGLLCLHSTVPHCWTDHEITTMADASRYLAVAVKNSQLVEERKKTAARLKKTVDELHRDRRVLNEKNIALKQVLEYLNKEKADFREEICESVQNLLMPIVAKLKNNAGKLEDRDVLVLADFLNSAIRKDIDDFRNNLSKLTPREFEFCDLMALGMSSKEISDMLNLSLSTVHKHRETIRRKLQITNKDINLASYLRTSMSFEKDK